MVEILTKIMTVSAATTIVMWVILGAASVWYEVFSKSPHWADRLEGVNKILRWLVYFGGVLVLIYLFIIRPLEQ